MQFLAVAISCNYFIAIMISDVLEHFPINCTTEIITIIDYIYSLIAINF